MSLVAWSRGGIIDWKHIKNVAVMVRALAVGLPHCGETACSIGLYICMGLYTSNAPAYTRRLVSVVCRLRAVQLKSRQVVKF